MAAAFINEVHRIGGGAGQDQCQVKVLYFGNGVGATEADVNFFAATNATDAQFKLAAGNAIVSAGATLGYTLTTANIMGAGT